MNKLKIIPIFESEKKELELWPEGNSNESISSTNEDSEKVNNTKSVTLKLPEYLLSEIQSIASKLEVDYKTLIKIYLNDRVNAELDKPLPKIYSNLK
ncbi:MAG: hypothetical protein FJ214_12080 [Ignavibacteria bacterium]|nr:hypothetical protein [Ignavibacteria bacterium]